MGKRTVVLGRSAVLGKPVGMLLPAGDATVTYCHSRTIGLVAIVGEADILVAGCGPAAVHTRKLWSSASVRRTLASTLDPEWSSVSNPARARTPRSGMARRSHRRHRCRGLRRPAGGDMPTPPVRCTRTRTGPACRT
ncbi:hypothetical protein [Sphaerisporangium rubeum]|uniref:hypothetical protein n=1 Tax=Sphaerisporangium rubeum TaxID=321317 RepID=UPI003CCDBC7E